MVPADFTNLGKRIRSLLFKRQAEAEAASGPASSGAGGALAHLINAEDFTEQLRSIAHDHGQVAVGRLQILGFQAIRARLGERWPLMQDRILQVIETSFRRRLEPHDVFRRHGDLVYLVIFANLSAEEARVKAHFIVEEIWQQLFGMSERDEAIDVSMLTINLETNQVEEVPDIDTLLNQHFEKAAQEAVARHLANALRPLPQPAAPAQPAAPTASLSPSSMPAPMPAPIPSSETETASQTGLSYTPLWQVRRKAVSSYYIRMCLIDGSNDAIYYGHDILRRAADPRDTYEFDLMTLARAQAAAQQLSQRRAPGVLVCPVHYTTLVNRVARLDYLDQCATLSRTAARHLVLEVGGLAEGFPPHTAFEIRHWLKPYCRAVSALVPPTPAAVHNLREAGFSAMGFEARQLGPPHRLASVAPAFAEAAHRHRMTAFIHGLATPEAVATAAEAGFDFLSGDAIQRPFAKILAPYRLTLEQIISPDR